MADAQDVRRLALSLDGVEEIGSDGFDFRVGGRGFVWSYPERVPGKRRVLRTDIAVLYVGDEAERQALLLGEPDLFFSTPSYERDATADGAPGPDRPRSSDRARHRRLAHARARVKAVRPLSCPPGRHRRPGSTVRPGRRSGCRRAHIGIDSTIVGHTSPPRRHVAERLGLSPACRRIRSPRAGSSPRCGSLPTSSRRVRTCSVSTAHSASSRPRAGVLRRG